MSKNKKDTSSEYQRPPAKKPVTAENEKTVIANTAKNEATKPKKDKQKKKVRKATVFKYVVFNMLKTFFVMFCIGLIIGSILLVQIVQYVVFATEDDDAKLDIENIALNQTSYFMVLNPDNPNAKEENDWIEYQELVGPEHRIWVPLSQIPDDLVNAVVATEDREFYTHHGVSFKRTAYALLNEVFEFQDKSFGASTIDQQLVKNLTGDDDVSDKKGDRTVGYLRKMREIFRAWGLNNNYSKDMIMEAYLNTMSLSGTIAGVQAGAQKYFGKDVADLTLWESATIAGITKAPSYYDPFTNPETSKIQRDSVLMFMRDTGKITEEEFQYAISQPFEIRDRNSHEGLTGSNTVFSYFSDTAFEQLVTDMMEVHGFSREKAIDYIYTAGLRVYLTVDLNVQDVLDDMYLNGYEEGGFFLDPKRFPGYERSLTVHVTKDKNGNPVEPYDILPQSAAVVMNYDGELVAVVGGIGPKTENLVLNRAVGTVVDGEIKGSVRQVGSTMKPIAAYALGIDYGLITYSTMVEDSGVLVNKENRQIVDAESGAVARNWPKNFSNTYRNRGIPVVSAISESTNTVAVRVGMWVGKDTMFDFLHDTLQVKSLDDPRDRDLAPLVLGSMTYGMSAYELASSYMMFGGGEKGYGVYTTPHCYSKIEDAKGNLVYQPEIVSVQAINPQSGYVVNRMMSTVLRGGAPGVSPTAGGMAPAGGMDSVAKTGTTSDDKDRWFVGLTPYYITTVWWGYDEDYDFYGKWSPSARTNPPPNVWKYLMETVQEELPEKQFPAPPDGIQAKGYCTISGDLANAGCPTAQGYYTDFGLPAVCTGAHEEPEEKPEGE